MARTIAEIKKEITDDFMTNAELIEKYNEGEQDETRQIPVGGNFEEWFSKASWESMGKHNVLPARRKNLVARNAFRNAP